jgi:hypothetical protein
MRGLGDGVETKLVSQTHERQGFIEAADYVLALLRLAAYDEAELKLLTRNDTALLTLAGGL